MKNFKRFIIATCLMALCVSLMSQAQQMCGTDAIHQSRLQTDATYAAQYNLMNNNVQSLVMQNQNAKYLNPSFMAVVNIPVVVHVVHLGEAVGTGTNVSDASINAMLADLNNRFANANGNGVNMNVQFCLAVRDPNNNATTGITRHNGSSIPGYSANGVGYEQPSPCGGANDTLIKNLSDWTCTSYYNIWIVKQICDAGGYATLPWAVVKWDGMVIGAGSMTNGQLFAHETGHWLNLLHTFQGQNGTTCPPNANCATDGDQVCDTPPILQSECGASSVCVGGSITNSASNYLSYCFATWDRFTQGQKNRVTSCLNTYPRNLLTSSLGCVPLTPNDAGISSITNPANTTYNTACGGANYSTAPIVQLRNYGTSTLTSVSIKYKIDNNAASTYSWSGSLAAFTSANVTLPAVSIPQGAHTFQAYTTLPNGASDGYNPNDSSSVSVTVTGPTAVTATSSQTNTTCVGNNGTATVNPSGGTLQTTVNNLTDFESAHGWTIVNGTQPNVWCAGTAAPYAGSNSIYVSAAANGCANNNSTGSQSATVHFYKDFTFPANSSNIQLSFVWRNYGGYDCSFTTIDSSDYFNAYLIATSTTPVAGTLPGSGKIGGKYSNKNSFSSTTIGGLDANAGSTRRLVFTWANDFCTFNPAASIDNINVSYTQTFVYNYLWSNGQTTQTATSLAPGTYTCTITDGNGCTGTKSVTILNGCAGVTISAGGPTTFCQGGSVVLTSSLTTGNVWSTGATTQSITVSTSGSYNCTNSGNTSNTIVVMVNPIPATPTISNGGPTTFCQGGSVTLTSSSATGNLWSTGATTQSINVTTSGTYTVTVTTNGCTSSPSAGKVVTVNPIPSTPTISAGGPTTFCQGGSVTLTSSSATGNTWSPGGATTQSINVTASGTYTVVVTSNGCTSSPSAGTTVTVQTCGGLTITAGGPTTFCSGGNVVLTSSIATGNVWSNGATTQSITVTTSGSYNCTNNGSTSNTIAVTVKPLPSSTTSQTGTVSLCSGSLINGPVSGSAANLDGIDDHITIQNHIVAATSFSAEAWVYWKGGGNWQRVFNFGNGPNFYILLTTKNSVNSMPRFAINIGAGDQLVDGNTAFPTNEWHHIAITLSGTTAKLYLDGNVIGTNNSFNTNPTSLGATINNWIGRSDYVSDPYFNGYIDEVRFWNVARTQSQLQTNMNKTIGVATSGLLAYYKLDEDSGTAVLESVSGNSTATANNGTAWLVPSSVPWNALSYAWSNGASTQGINVTAAATYTVTVTAASGCTATSAPVIVSSVKPKPSATITAGGPTTICTGGSVTLTAPGRGNALQFDGSNDYVATTTPMIPVSGSYSILFWAKEGVNQTGYREIISQGRNFYIGRDNTGIIRVGDNWLNTGVNWPTDLQWHHYAVTRNSFNTFLYIDGNLAATKGSAIGSPIVVAGTPNLFVIGDQFAHGINENFNGQVDDITIWNNVRSLTQIQTAMNSSVATTATGLVAYYKLDEGTGASTLNVVNGGDAGTLTNGPAWVVPSSLPYNIASYSWSTGASTQGITATAKATYKVTVANNVGCTATATKKVAVSTPGASITVTGSLQLCGGSTVTFTANAGTGLTYQWTKNGANIGGATNQVYVANSAGTYRVLVTNTYGCTKLSASKVVTECARLGEVVETLSENNLSVFPNPTADFITVSFDSEDGVADIQIVNVEGATVLKKQFASDEGTYEEPLDVSKLAPGMYVILVRTQNDGVTIKRFVKQ